MMRELLLIAAMLGMVVLPVPDRASGRTAVMQTTRALVLTLYGIDGEGSHGTGSLEGPVGGANRTYPVEWDGAMFPTTVEIIVRTYSYLRWHHYREITSVGVLSHNCVPDCAESNGMVYWRLWTDRGAHTANELIPPARTTFYFVKR